jgi:lipoprotein-releasing system ATP-binding protein
MSISSQEVSFSFTGGDRGRCEAPRRLASRLRVRVDGPHSPEKDPAGRERFPSGSPTAPSQDVATRQSNEKVGDSGSISGSGNLWSKSKEVIPPTSPECKALPQLANHPEDGGKSAWDPGIGGSREDLGPSGACRLIGLSPATEDLLATRELSLCCEYGVASEHPRRSKAGTEVAIAACKLFKSYTRGTSRVEVLRELELEVFSGEFLAVVGHSGSGKSTLLHLLATLDRPDQGEIFFRGKRIDHLPGRQRDRLRNKHFGMVFQMYHLLPELTALENVMLPLMIPHGPLALLTRWRSIRRKALEWLAAVGLTHRAHHKPRELSGGEMQRVAIARALVHHPEVLFADEPTGNLDRQTGWEILELLRRLNHQHNLTIVMVTHDPQVAGIADRIVRLQDGRIVPVSA